MKTSFTWDRGLDPKVSCSQLWEEPAPASKWERWHHESDDIIGPSLLPLITCDRQLPNSVNAPPRPRAPFTPVSDGATGCTTAPASLYGEITAEIEGWEDHGSGFTSLLCVICDHHSPGIQTHRPLHSPLMSLPPFLLSSLLESYFPLSFLSISLPSSLPFPRFFPHHRFCLKCQ